MIKWTNKIARALILKFIVIWPDKLTKILSSAEMLELMIAEWLDGLKDIDVQAVKGALTHCKLHLVWPPSISEFRKICRKYEGYPDLDEAFNLALRQEFTHPIIKKAYLVIGSHAFKNAKDEDLKNKFTKVYNNLLLMRSDEFKQITEFFNNKSLEIKAEEDNKQNTATVDYKQHIKGSTYISKPVSPLLNEYLAKTKGT